MAGLWLNQCGETDATRLAFEFTATFNSDETISFSGDVDAKDGEASGRLTAYGATSSRVFLDRQMEHGWWLLEWEITNPILSDPIYGYSTFQAALTPGLFPGFSSTPADVGATYPWALEAGGALLVYRSADPAYDIGDLIAETTFNFSTQCSRLAFVLDLVHGWPESGDPAMTVLVRGTWLACADCPEPI